MPSIKKILCAVDFSSSGPLLADYAVTIAKAFDAEVLVIYATPPMSQYAGFEVQPRSIEMFVGEITIGAEKAMTDLMEKNFKGVKASSKVVIGYPPEEILSMADTFGADLIIMGTHGRKGLDRILFGSVAEYVVKSAKVPVLTIRPADE